jgi:membrane protease YdiL (CAAX protease family)
VLSGAGEEIGWRGYMLTRLIDAGVPMPLLASGIIWALWHFPLILSGVYAAGPHPAISAGLFLIDVVGIGYVIAVLRLRSGSVWPAAVLHGTWNAIIQGPFDQSSTGPGATVWVGESGILVAIVSLAVGLLAVRLYFYWTTRLVSTGKSK